jgi:Tol biopolymer transport system component
MKSNRAKLVVLSCAAALMAAIALAGPRLAKALTFQTITVNVGTNVAAAVSPADGHIVMDLQGVLWSLPAAGGTAQRLTEDFLEPARPDFSPDGKLVAFQAYKGGTFHIWVMNTDGTGVRQLTSGHGDDREPHFSPDGTKIAFGSDRAFNGTYDIWVTDLNGNLSNWTSTAATVASNIDEFEPAFARDGSGEIAYVIGTGIWSKSATGAPHQIIANTNQTTHSPAYSPSGKKLAWVQSANNKSRLVVRDFTDNTTTEYPSPLGDVFPFYPQWTSEDTVVYTADGQIFSTRLSSKATTAIPFQATFQLDRPEYQRKKFDFDSNKQNAGKGIVGPALSPDAKRVAFEALNQIYVMEIGKKPTAITNDTYYKTDPAWSHDGTKLAYSSDRAGTMDVWIYDLATGTATRATTNDSEAEVSAAWSPDDKSIAFQDHLGAAWTMDLATKTVKPLGPVDPQTRQPVLTLFAPSKPSWHASGNTIALGALKPYTRRFREGTSQILTVNVASTAFQYTEPAPFESLSTRGEDGPVYSPDGTAIVFSMHGVLYTRPVDGNGVPTWSAQQITSEPSDAPTWSGDSRQILYLSNGQLRLVNSDGSNARTIDVDLNWQAEQPAGTKVIWAGTFWDGRGPQVQTNVDITVVGNRVKSIDAHNPNRGAFGNSPNFIDASKQFVMPGLWESHTHEWIEGKFYGDKLGRLWLAYGVTTLNSVGDPVYRALETRESFGSGARVGPRYFATGEAVDGERVFYNFMRPVDIHDQLDVELSRAKSLNYDMVKTYVRLQHEWQAEVAQKVHDQMGVYLGSHYMLPGLAHNMDVQTHVSATTRTGFAYTRSGSGISYDDMRTLFAKGGMTDISTTFNSSLYAEDQNLVVHSLDPKNQTLDPRLAILNPAWDNAGLLAKRTASLTTDQTVSLDSLKKEEETVSALINKGGIALAGTDSPLDNVATALHLNLRAQEKFGGRENWSVLQTATYLPAKMVGVLDDLGSLEPGKLADLIVVNGNPLASIKDLANVTLVMKNGRIYTIDELEAPFAKPAGAASSLRAPKPPVLKHARTTDQRFWFHNAEEMGEDD